MIKFIKDILAPKKCYSCKKEWHFLCPKCLSKMYNFSDICYVCKKKSKYFSVHNECKKGIFYDNLIILTHYKNNTISKLIKDLKFYNRKDILEDFWKYLWEILLKNIFDKKENFVIIPIPMNLFKKIFRWYNQSEILAEYISKNTWIKIEKNLIKKIKNTRQQSKLNRQQRIKNLKNSFKLNKTVLDKLDKKTFIIVDDVVSTWTTINTISKILKQNWVKKVIGLTIASD